MFPSNEQAWQAHRRYVSTGHLAKDLLREPIYRAWARCHEQGASPRRVQATQLDLGELERLIAEEQRLLQAARPYMHALSQAAGGERHAAMLGDARGVVLDVLGDPASILGPERVPGPGSLLSEAVCGANGIGTALAEGAYTSLVGPEHFIAGFHAFTCQGVPLRAPEGACCGVISVSVRRIEAADRLRELLVCAAHGIEAELIRGRLDDDLRRLITVGAPDDDAPLEQLRQDIVQAQARARLEVSVAARDVAHDRLDYALRLIAAAQRSIAEFTRRSAVWRALASAEGGPHGAVDVGVTLRDLVELLRTEAATARVALHLAPDAPLFVEADARLLARRLFRGLMRAIGSARGGGAVRVGLARGPDRAGEVVLRVEPAGDGVAALNLSIAVGPIAEAPPC